jgi:phosphatidylserine synthase 2
MIIVIISNFLTGFLLINGLWIPPKNYLNIFRLLIWFLLASVTFGELYDDIETWGSPKRKEQPISAEFRYDLL